MSYKGSSMRLHLIAQKKWLRIEDNGIHFKALRIRQSRNKMIKKKKKRIQIKGKNKIIQIHRWHDLIHRKGEGTKNNY